MRVIATLLFPGAVFQLHENAIGLPPDVDHRTPWVRGAVPGGDLIVFGVVLGTVQAVRPDAEAITEYGQEHPSEWVTTETAVDLILDLSGLTQSLDVNKQMPGHVSLLQPVSIDRGQMVEQRLPELQRGVTGSLRIIASDDLPSRCVVTTWMTMEGSP